VVVKEWGKNQVCMAYSCAFFFLFYFDKANTEKKKQNLKKTIGFSLTKHRLIATDKQTHYYK